MGENEKAQEEGYFVSKKDYDRLLSAYMKMRGEMEQMVVLMVQGISIATKPVTDILYEIDEKQKD